MENVMNHDSCNVLLIEDNPGDERLIREMFNESVNTNYQVVCENTLNKGLQKIEGNNIDIILLDLSLPDSHGLETFFKVQEVAFDLPIIVLTGLQDEETALAALQNGAQDYLPKNIIEANLLMRSVQYGIKRKQMDEQLQLLATGMHSASNVVFITDREGVIEWINPAFTAITGYSAYDAIGNKPSLLKSGEHEADFYNEMWRTILSGEVWRSEVVNRRKDGSLYIVEQTVTPFSGHSREITHFVAIQQDITNRKKAEATEKSYLRELEALLNAASSLRKAESSEEVLSTMLSQSLQALDLKDGYISIYNPQSGLLHRMISKGWFEDMEIQPMAPDAGITGRVFSSGEAFISDHLSTEELISPERRKQIPEDWAGMCLPIRTEHEIVGVLFVLSQHPHVSTKQEIRFLESIAEIGGSTLHRLRLFEETRDNAQQLSIRVQERTQELTRALRVKDEFLANMSHELRTPLNAILGLSESLAEMLAGPLNQKQQRYVSTIMESGQHLLALINDILDLAKIEAGQAKLEFSEVAVDAVCQASLRMIKQLAQNKKLQVGFELDPKIRLIYADERRLKQMLVNLLSNAVKFTPEGRKIGLQAHQDPDSGNIHFTVWDEGIGISEANLPQLFQPFVQLDGTLERENSGTGLGLSLVSQMAGLHGGSVSVNSELGKGSRFTIVLPYLTAQAPTASKKVKQTGRLHLQKQDSKKKNPTILLIEDVKEVTMMIQDYLEYEGFNVVIAEDGLEGVNQAKTIFPDLILMDIQMPRLNGLDATRLLRGDAAFKDTPIIALTALAMTNDRERCLEAGMNEYISKPVNLKNLVKVIQGLLSDKFVFLPENEQETQPAAPPYRILVVDDEVNILKSLTRSLRLNFDVITAMSGQDALGIIQKGGVTLILTDQRMPYMTGLELLEKAREISPNTPGLLLSGYSDSESLAKTLNLDNVLGYIPKPWNENELIQQLENAVRNNG